MPGVKLPRLINGMLRTPDHKYVSGNLKIVASSISFLLEHQSKIFQKVKFGINSNNLKGEHAYAFFPFPNEGYVACHLQLSKYMEILPAKDKNEPIIRGQPVFTEYIWLSDESLKNLEWNLLPIFGKMKEMEYPIEVIANLPEYIIDNSEQISNSWFLQLKKKSVVVEATLIELLSSESHVQIIAAPEDFQMRLDFLVGIIQCVPAIIRKQISFATAANPSSTSARIFFPTSQASGNVVDWVNPKTSNSEGSKYSAWVLQQIIDSDTHHAFKRKIDDELKMPVKSTDKSLGMILDIAVELQVWKPMDLVREEQIDTLVNDIQKFEPFLSNDDIADWLFRIIALAIKLFAYPPGIQALKNHVNLFADQDAYQNIITRVVQDIFAKADKDTLQTLAQFLREISQYAGKTNQLHLLHFAQDVTLGCIKNDYDKGLVLLSFIKDIEWVIAPDWFALAIQAVDRLNKVEQFKLLIENIRIPIEQDSFICIADLIQRSSIELQKKLSTTQNFILDLQDLPSEQILSLLIKSYLEVDSDLWLFYLLDLQKERVGSYPDSTLLKKHFGIKEIERLASTALSAGFLKVASYLFLSIIRLRLELSNLDRAKFDQYLDLLSQSDFYTTYENLDILSSQGALLTSYQLSSLLIFIKAKLKLSTSKSSPEALMTLRRILDGKLRAEKISSSLIDYKIGKSNDGEIAYFYTVMLQEILVNRDASAWQMIYSLSRNNQNLNRFYWQTMINAIKSFDFSSQQYMLNFVYELRSNGLAFEADLATFALLPYLASLSSEQFAAAFIQAVKHSITLPPTFTASIEFILGDQAKNRKVLSQTINRKNLSLRDLANLKSAIENSEQIQKSSIRYSSLMDFVDPLPNNKWGKFLNVILKHINTELKESTQRRK